jgi:hypothetical protein
MYRAMSFALIIISNTKTMIAPKTIPVISRPFMRTPEDLNYAFVRRVAQSI